MKKINWNKTLKSRRRTKRWGYRQVFKAICGFKGFVDIHLMIPMTDPFTVLLEKWYISWIPSTKTPVMLAYIP